MGKGVYCEKPLTRSIYEARELARAAHEAGVATQMGNQGHSTDDIRCAVEWIRDGVIGTVREVHAWRGGPNKPMPFERPIGTPPLPEGLYWDLWRSDKSIRSTRAWRFMMPGSRWLVRCGRCRKPMWHN